MRPSDLSFDRLALRSSGDVRIRWLGTAGFEIEHDGWVVLIDPYLSRPPLRSCLLSPLQPDVKTIRRYISTADAIVCGHTHFDHALDVPAIARFTGAKVYGSRSAMTLCRASGIPEDRLTNVQSDTGLQETRAEVGPFELRFVPSAHSPIMAGRVPYPGDIAERQQVPMRIHAYRCGSVFGVLVKVAGRNLYHMGSANLLDEVRPSLRAVDLLLLTAAGWTATPKLVQRIFRGVSPAAVLLTHWDNYFRPIDRQPRALPTLRLARLVDELTRESRHLSVGTLPLFGDLLL